MGRKYRKVAHLVEYIREQHEGGKTYREIGKELGLSREEIRGAVRRQNRKERQIAAGYIPRRPGRPKKEAASEEVKLNNEIVQLQMTVELLRNFLSEVGRR